MNALTWSEKYELGSERIDKQHMHLFECLTRFVQRCWRAVAKST